MPQRIQLLRGTTAEWVTDDIVLLNGELGVDTDTGIMKLGDGTAAWSALEGSRLAPATTDAIGGVELATNAETIAGTDTLRAVTPAGAAAAFPLSPDIRNIVQVTQAAYDLLTPDADTLYVIVG